MKVIPGNKVWDRRITGNIRVSKLFSGEILGQTSTLKTKLVFPKTSLLHICLTQLYVYIATNKDNKHRTIFFILIILTQSDETIKIK